MVYVAFVFDVYSRRILGWRAATNMRKELVLDALEMAVWTRARDGVTDLTGLVHHTDAGSQYTSIKFTERLAEAGAAPSVGTVGDAYDTQSMIVGWTSDRWLVPGARGGSARRSDPAYDWRRFASANALICRPVDPASTHLEPQLES